MDTTTRPRPTPTHSLIQLIQLTYSSLYDPLASDMRILSKLLSMLLTVTIPVFSTALYIRIIPATLVASVLCLLCYSLYCTCTLDTGRACVYLVFVVKAANGD
ncbi:hypothetical protein FB45DRAFT_938003 [Roridomyces roridus]|uniref:Uncharacterized protein n=1 Tax=Roridomyces roridus TaxID=1738132 RepID=A0AAD7B9E4_9AGAR|nr:hypothetical protein FB45DRAFT_938003 [Roridomyces roridus]